MLQRSAYTTPDNSENNTPGDSNVDTGGDFEFLGIERRRSRSIFFIAAAMAM
ncbi:MAG: hypothetical protein JWQ49_5783 [Edaphobacter sp.]|nr:hypothetical protein [Edaphobacter sp.]